MTKNEGFYSEPTFAQISKKHYYLTLLDVLCGASLLELNEDIAVYEEAERFEICSGISNAISFCETNTFTDIKKEYVRLTKEFFE